MDNTSDLKQLSPEQLRTMVAGLMAHSLEQDQVIAQQKALLPNQKVLSQIKMKPSSGTSTVDAVKALITVNSACCGI